MDLKLLTDINSKILSKIMVKSFVNLSDSFYNNTSKTQEFFKHGFSAPSFLFFVFVFTIFMSIFTYFLYKLNRQKKKRVLLQYEIYELKKKNSSAFN